MTYNEDPGLTECGNLHIPWENQQHTKNAAGGDLLGKVKSDTNTYSNAVERQHKTRSENHRRTNNAGNPTRGGQGPQLLPNSTRRDDSGQQVERDALLLFPLSGTPDHALRSSITLFYLSSGAPSFYRSASSLHWPSSM